MKYANHPGISIWMITVCFSVGEDHDITTRGRWVDSILLATYIIGSVIDMENLMAIKTILLEEDFVQS